MVLMVLFSKQLISRMVKYRLTFMFLGEIVAIKKMKKKYTKWDQCINQKEIQSLMKLSHPNIVQLYEVILDRSTLHFVFEFLDMNVY